MFYIFSPMLAFEGRAFSLQKKSLMAANSTKNNIL